jgi:hypothetical protein
MRVSLAGSSASVDSKRMCVLQLPAVFILSKDMLLPFSCQCQVCVLLFSFAYSQALSK